MPHLRILYMTLMIYYDDVMLLLKGERCSTCASADPARDTIKWGSRAGPGEPFTTVAVFDVDGVNRLVPAEGISIVEIIHGSRKIAVGT